MARGSNSSTDAVIAATVISRRLDRSNRHKEDDIRGSGSCDGIPVCNEIKLSK